MSKTTALLALAFAATATLAFSAHPDYEYEGTVVTETSPGTVPVVPAKPVMVSFEPMPPERDECGTKVITATVEKAPVMSSFPRMPDERRPTVACNKTVAVTETAQVIQPAPRVEVEETVSEPVRQAPVVVYEPPAELPATGSPMPLVGLVGLLSLGGAAMLRAGRRLFS